MSKSLKRVKSALFIADPTFEIIETGQATTAKAAAESLGCAVDQIAKSILFEGALSGALYLFVTAGARQIDAVPGGESEVAIEFEDEVEYAALYDAYIAKAHAI